MKTLRKSRLSVALGAAIGTAALAPMVGYGSVDIRDFEIVTDQSGDSVLYPFYTTVDGATTSFSLTNTSPTQTVAAKVRFREQTISDDVLDFIVVLSPNDKFDFWVSQAAGAARPTAYWKDNSCVIGYPNVTDELKSLPFPASLRGIADDAMSVGHVEVIGMINLNNLEDRAGNDLNIAAVHNENGFPLNCQVLREVFKTRENMNEITYEGAPIWTNLARADVGNVLIGGFLLTAGEQGIEAGANPITVRNTFNRAFIAAQSAQTCKGIPPYAGGDPLSQGGLPEGCFQLYTWDGTEDSHPHLGDINWVGVDGFAGFNTVARLDDLLTAGVSLRGDWSNNTANNVGFDWIATFPTKYVYVDRPFPGEGCSSGDDYVNVGNKLVGNFPPGPLPGQRCAEPTPFGVRLTASTTDHCIIGDDAYIFMDVFNTEEGSTTTESPGVNDPLLFCPETEVFTIVSEGVIPEPSLIQSAARRGVIEYDPSLFGVRGWADVPINWYPNELVPTHASNVRYGAATSGLLFLVRATTDPMVNNGSLRELESNSGRQE